MKKNILFIFIAIIYAQAVFYDITEQTGTEYSYPHFHSHLGAGVTIVDINNDGLDDIISSTYTGDNIKVFMNMGNLNFSESASNLGISTLDESKQVLVADYNNDGYNDLYIINHFNSSVLYKNINNEYFVDVTLESGLTQESIAYRAGAWFDYNKDGFLDLFIVNYDPEHENIFYENNGDGTFSDITLSAGVGGGLEKTALVVAAFDYDNDGWADIYVGNDREQGNYLYKNMHNGTFLDVSENSGAGIPVSSMAVAICDYENDNDLDIYITNVEDGNKFLKNNGDGTFSEIADELGLSINRITWGANFIDFNNDGLQDLYVASACDEMLTICDDGILSNNDLLFIQNDDYSFVDYTDYSGLNDNYMSYGSAMGDIDNDGYVDLYVLHEFTTNILYLNQYANIYENNNWLKIKLEGKVSNYNAIGSRIYVYSSGQTYMKEVIVGSSYESQDSYRKVFGLGTAEAVDSIAVLWPSGNSSKFFNIQANQEITVDESGEIFCDYGSIDLGCGCGNPEAITNYDCYGRCINDEDNDGICYELDDCPNVYNPLQSDDDGDGLADACIDTDDDNDLLIDCWNYWYNDGILLSDIEKTNLINSGVCKDFTLENNNLLPSSIEFVSSFPNPFNPLTTISFNIITPSVVDISIYDINGYKVKELSQNFYNSGFHKLDWTPDSHISSGIYFVSLKTSDSFINHKILYLK